MSNGEIPAIIEEHPGDWIMREGPLSQHCSAFAYRLITIADRNSAKSEISPEQATILSRINQDIKALWGE